MTAIVSIICFDRTQPTAHELSRITCAATK